MITIKPNPDSGLVARRATAYAAVVLGCLAVAPWVDRLDWVGNAYIHTLHEMAAVILSLGVAAISLVRFYSRKSDTFLLLGSAFVGVAFLDAYHAAQAPNLLTTSPPWSWLASRLFLAVFLWWSAPTRRWVPFEARLDQRRGFLLGGAGGRARFAVFSLSPPPSPPFPPVSPPRAGRAPPAPLFPPG